MDVSETETGQFNNTVICDTKIFQLYYACI